MRAFTALIVAALVTIGSAASAGSLEILERERALVLETLLDPTLTPAERQESLATVRLRLVDLERMVVRDESLRGRNTPVVRRAFADYELTFLAHTSAEANTTLLDIWLARLGIGSEALAVARRGWR
ncbi:MAG: hypothetical protein QF670_12560 [Alphaproteobacteria bacterium]|jgi:hypothetical protein|nr:hypothetical protein [Alphaproteobacteria bacterium]MDP7174409.1 hypothetical protein [Alphaproteobacteria bacterium]MDP7488741.1 hypothetical protein [Alphaproteobacteria bacterium]MEE1544150.1 hypothetical protein [Alphaproteobacteria bacterium]|tara:strand:+ start:1637 stop:2017 length:381 start_codon:yes stop_codon:yes gene_type:complete